MLCLVKIIFASAAFEMFPVNPLLFGNLLECLRKLKYALNFNLSVKVDLYLKMAKCRTAAINRE